MTRTAILACIALILLVAVVNLHLFAALDRYIDGVAQQRAAASHITQIGKVTFRCFPVRRTK